MLRILIGIENFYLMLSHFSPDRSTESCPSRSPCRARYRTIHKPKIKKYMF